MLLSNISPIIDKLKTDLLKIVQSSENNLDFDGIEKISDELEKTLQKAYCEIFAQILQNNQPQQNTVLVNGEEYVFKEKVSKTFMSEAGKLTVERRVYRNSKGETYVPLDVTWKMDGEFAVPKLCKRIAYMAAINNPKEIEEYFKQFMAVQPSRDFIRKTADQVGKVLESSKEEILNLAHQQETVVPQVKTLAISADGANTAIRAKGTTARRPAFRPKSVKKNSSATQKNKKKSCSTDKSSIPQVQSSCDNEKNCCYKNVMVGTITFYGDKEPDQQTPKHLRSIYLAQMPEKNYPTFKHYFEQEVAQYSGLEGVQKVFIADGAPHLWKYKSETRLLDGYIEILDYYHATEQLNLLAESLFGESSPEAKKWYDHYSTLLLTDANGAKSMLRSAKYYQKKKTRSKSQDKIVQRELKYFRKNLSRMTYLDFRNRGLPIGSGPVEAACKTIVKARLCGSGMRWSLPGGQHILNLRVMVKSDRWNTAWKIYLKNRNNKNIIPA